MLRLCLCLFFPLLSFFVAVVIELVVVAVIMVQTAILYAVVTLVGQCFLLQLVKNCSADCFTCRCEISLFRLLRIAWYPDPHLTTSKCVLHPANSIDPLTIVRRLLVLSPYRFPPLRLLMEHYVPVHGLERVCQSLCLSNCLSVHSFISLLLFLCDIRSA